MSMSDEVIPKYIKADLVNWCLTMLHKSQSQEIHPYCLEFGAGLIANILQSPDY